MSCVPHSVLHCRGSHPPPFFLFGFTYNRPTSTLGSLAMTWLPHVRAIPRCISAHTLTCVRMQLMVSRASSCCFEQTPTDCLCFRTCVVSESLFCVLLPCSPHPSTPPPALSTFGVRLTSAFVFSKDITVSCDPETVVRASESGPSVDVKLWDDCFSAQTVSEEQ